MSECESVLRELGFGRVGEVVRDARGVRLVASDEKGEPGVYAWIIEKPNGSKEAGYVGKAGRGLKIRFGQHHQGFLGRDRNGSTTGARNLRYIEETLDQGNAISIYFRRSGTQKIFGIEVPSISIEEEAAIKRLNPIWNGRSRVADEV